MIPVNDIVTIIIAGNVMSIERETDLALVTLMSQILLRIAYVCLWLLKRKRDIYLGYPRISILPQIEEFLVMLYGVGFVALF